MPTSQLTTQAPQPIRRQNAVPIHIMFRRHIQSLSAFSTIAATFALPVAAVIFTLGHGIAIIERRFSPNLRQRKGAQFFLGRNDVAESTEIADIKAKLDLLKEAVSSLSDTEKPSMLLIAIRDICDYIENHLEGDLFSIKDSIYKNRVEELILFLDVIETALNDINEAKVINAVTEDDKTEVNADVLYYYAAAVSERVISGAFLKSSLKGILVQTYDAEIVNFPQYFSLKNFHSTAEIKRNGYIQPILKALATLKENISYPFMVSVITEFEALLKVNVLQNRRKIKGYVLRATLNEMERLIEVMGQIVLFPPDQVKKQLTLYLINAHERTEKGSFSKELVKAISRALAYLQQIGTNTILPKDSPLHAYELPHTDFIRKEKLGIGTYGTVYKARWKGKVDVAIKRSNKDPDPRLDRKLQDSLIEEATLLSQLDSPFVAKLYAVSFSDNTFNVVMEYIPQRLFSLLYEGKGKTNLSWDVRQLLACDVARGVQYLHRTFTTSVLHRDIKSDNVLVTADWRAKVVDFSSSKMQSEGPVTPATTPGWAAPETLKGQPYTPLVDVYSFGVLVFEMAGRGVMWHYGTAKGVYNTPFGSMSDSEKRTALHTGCPQVLSDLIITCTQNRPDDRLPIDEVVTQFQNVYRAQLPPPPMKAPALIF